MKKTSLVLVLILASLGPLSFAWSDAGLSDAQIKMMGLIPIAEKPNAPELTLSDMAGKRITLSSLKGKTVLLNFWATWCPPCREEMPTLETLYQSFKGRSDFVLLAVDSSEEKATVSDFLKKNPYHFPVLLDSDGAVSYHYSISAIPTTFLIDAQGRIIAGTRGAFDWNKKEFTDGLKALLAGKK